VEVKIGVQYATRELVLESAQSPEEIEEAIATAIRSEMGMLSLQDEKGRRVLVPVSKLAYVEIAEPEQRRVGFAAMS
jgi:3-hydroxyacyl-CoA dehydrogenase